MLPAVSRNIKLNYGSLSKQLAEAGDSSTMADVTRPSPTKSQLKQLRHEVEMSNARLVEQVEKQVWNHGAAYILMMLSYPS